MKIESGEGYPHELGVTENHQARVVAENQELQHYIALHDEQVFQVIANDDGITAKTQTILHIKNTSTTHWLVVTFVRVQAITDTASKPVAGEYWQLGGKDTVSSGGSVITPDNTVINSGETADAVITGNDPTMSGDFTEMDRWRNDNSEHAWNKQGSILLGLNATFEARFVSSGAGVATARITFMFVKKENA